MKTAECSTLGIDAEFKALIPPLAEGEYRQLEDNLKQDGCRDPLVTWDDILIDGHNRYEICERLGIDYDVREMDFADRDAAKVWIIRNQFGRRNLAPFQRAELALALEPLIAAKAKANQRAGGGKAMGSGAVRQKSDEPVETKKELAKVAGVSHDTIHKAKIIATKATEQVKNKLRSGETSINAAYKDIRKAERKEENQRKERESAKAAPAERLWRITADQSVVKCNALITDPPYGILDEQWEPSDLEKFTREWAARWAKCGADLALIFWSQRYLWEGRGWFDESLNGYSFQQLLVWHYPNNKSPQSRMGFKQTWEPIFLYRRKDSGRKIEVNAGEWGDGLNDFDCHVAAVPQGNFNDAEMKQHPAQKPVAVMRWLVGATTQPGELVCDPFAGSGTTGIAATELGRRFIGIESNDEYRKIAEGRLALYGR